MNTNYHWVFLLIALSPILVQSQSRETKEVKVYDQFLGQGDSLVIEAARYNSKKGYLIALVSTDDPDLLKITIEVMTENIIRGRTRMTILLGDKKPGTHNSVIFFANGNYIDGFLQLGNGVGSGYEMTRIISEIYKKHIEPKYPASP